MQWSVSCHAALNCHAGIPATTVEPPQALCCTVRSKSSLHVGTARRYIYLQAALHNSVWKGPEEVKDCFSLDIKLIVIAAQLTAPPPGIQSPGSSKSSEQLILPTIFESARKQFCARVSNTVDYYTIVVCNKLARRSAVPTCKLDQWLCSKGSAKCLRGLNSVLLGYLHGNFNRSWIR